MSSGFGELTTQANELVAAGDLAAAQELLSAALEDADPSPANAPPELAEAAGLHARVLVTLGDPHSARGWAAFAYAATTRLHGPADPRTVAASATLAAVLHRVGSHARAARLYRDVIIELTATDGPESLRVLAAHADLATVEYARGDCVLARDRLEDAWQLHREVYGEGHPSGIKMLARLGAMQRDCGLFSEAHGHLALAHDLCRQHLPVDHSLALQVAALKRAAADPDHVCDPGPTQSEQAGAAAPPTPAALIDPAGIDATTPPRIPPPRTPGQPTEPYHEHLAEPRRPEQPAAEPYRVVGSLVPPPRTTTDRSTAGDESAHPDPAHPAWRASESGDVDSGGDRWWPPEVAAPDGNGDDPESDPYRDDRWLAGTSALPPAVPDFTTSRRASGESRFDLPEEAPGVHTVRHLPATRSGNRLPAALPRPTGGPNRRMLPIVLAGAVVVLLGTAAVVAGFALADDPITQPERPPLRPTPTRTTVAPAPPGAAPTEVSLRDNRDSITLTWVYPAGAEGPVLISGGRTGQAPRAFQELPAGSTSHVVYGLPDRQDYCFLVAVVYSTDTIGRAEPVCTDRGGSTPRR